MPALPPDATTTSKGVVQLAGDLAGTAAAPTVVAASETVAGKVELATTAEGQAGTDPTRVLTPMVGKQSVLGWLLSQDGAGSGLDADMLDGQQGEW